MLIRRHHWSPDQIAALPDGYAEELAEAEAGLDMAAEVAQKRQRRKNTPPAAQDDGAPVFGMPGVRVPRRRG